MKSTPISYKTMLLLLAVLISATLLACSHFQKNEDVARIGPNEARAAVVNNEALLVCAYDDKSCQDILLDGAMLRSEFEAQLASLPKRQTIIFYCG